MTTLKDKIFLCMALTTQQEWKKVVLVSNSNTKYSIVPYQTETLCPKYLFFTSDNFYIRKPKHLVNYAPKRSYDVKVKSDLLNIVMIDKDFEIYLSLNSLKQRIKDALKRGIYDEAVLCIEEMLILLYHKNKISKDKIIELNNSLETLKKVQRLMSSNYIEEVNVCKLKFNIILDELFKKLQI